jgi:D-alanine-D-alanine ligase-like ATP-grasp enzyme
LSELPKNPTDIVVELADKCHQTASLLGQYFDLRIVGLDMAVDQQGRIWFLEMNASPMFRKMLKELGDTSMYKRAI